LTARDIDIRLSSLVRRAAENTLVARRPSVRWTWVVSFCLHALILLPLAFVAAAPPQLRAASASITPTARIEPPRGSITSSTLLPKPKVAGPASIAAAADLPAVSPDPAHVTAVNEMLKPIARSDSPAAGSDSLGHSRYIAPKLEFFGTPLDSRKVCFVVDASGSMLGLFSAVRAHLAQSIRDLQPDQYFSIIFFNDRLYESSPGTLVRATASAKSSAISFINSIEPAGPTNPVVALRKAMQARDSSGDAPALICFLTDGFDLAPGDADSLPADIDNLRKQLAPSARINTIGFWTQPHDCTVLQKIATRSAGRFTSVAN